MELKEDVNETHEEQLKAHFKKLNFKSTEISRDSGETVQKLLYINMAELL